MNVLPDVPSDWTTATVARYCDVQLGKMLQNDPASEDDELKPYLRAINISKNGVDFAKHFEMWIRPSERERFRLIRGDILVSEGGDAGRTTTFDSDDEYYFQNAINRVRPNSSRRVVPEFLAYWFEYLKLSGFVEMVCNVATIQHFTAEKVKAAPLAFPDIDAQRHIARFLDRKTASIDALIVKKRALLERLAEKRQALITQAVTKGLDPAVPMKDSGIPWLGRIPAHWDALPLRRVVCRVATGRTPPTTQDDYFTDGDVNWYTPGDFADGAEELADAERKIAQDALNDGAGVLFPAGAVMLVAIGATLGKVAVTTAPASANQQINAILLEPGNDAHYLAYLLHGFRNEVRVMSNANTLGILNQNATKALPVLRPPPQEQQAIAARLIAQDRQHIAVVRAISRSIVLLQEQRSAWITAAVTGQLEIPADGSPARPDESLGKLATEVG